MVVGGDDSGRDNGPSGMPVNPHVFDAERHQLPAIGDRPSETRIDAAATTDHARACAVTLETANLFLRRTSQLTPSEIKLIAQVLRLGKDLNLWTPEHKQQISGCLEERASHQSNPNAARGLRNLSGKFNDA